MWPNPQVPADFVTFTEEMLNGKYNFLWNITPDNIQHLTSAAPQGFQVHKWVHF